jgi:hypothetical protein
MLNKNVLKAVLGCAALLMFQGASASTVVCSGDGYDVNKNVSTARDCAILLPLNGAVNDHEDVVNTEQFFGIDNWMLDGKYDSVGESSGQDSSSLFDFTGGNQSGTYTYVGTGTAPTSIMFVFKDGGDTNLVAYLLTSPYDEGTYATPFTEPPFIFPGNDARAISHISVYYQHGDTPPPNHDVPEPATLAIMGLGLLGMSRLRRKN